MTDGKVGRLRAYGGWVAALALAAVVLALLYVKTRAVDFERHAEVVDRVSQSRHRSAVLKQQVLAIRFGLLGQYDPLTRTLAEIDASQRALGQAIRHLGAGEDAELDRAIRDLDRVADARRSKAERFKRENAILKNSLYYLPVAADRLTRKLDVDRGEPGPRGDNAKNAEPTAGRRYGELVLAIHGLVRTTLVYNLQGDAELRARHQRQLAALTDRQKEVPSELRGEFDLLLAHAGTIERQQDIVDPLVNDLLDNSLEDGIEALRAVYERRFEASVAQANRYRIVLYLWSVLLLVLASFAGYKLRRLYRDLERLVAERTRELNLALQDLWGEMKLARKIQTALVPPQPTLKGCDVAAVMKPAVEVGGDYYDVVEAGGREWILIGDVSGHGVSAGLVMMMCQTAVHTALAQDPKIEPDRLLAVVNQALTGNIRRLGEKKYMTLSAICRDESGRFHLTGLHQDVYIYRAATRSVEELRAAGAWLGIVNDIQGKLRVDTFELGYGDVLLLYTDGVTEARREGEMLDNIGLKSMFERIGGGSASEIVSSILDELASYEVNDDIALVAIKQQ